MLELFFYNIIFYFSHYNIDIIKVKIKYFTYYKEIFDYKSILQRIKQKNMTKNK